jgi:hypothetical protein
MADTQPVEVYNPQGKLGTIPPAQLDAAKAAGYKPKSDYVEVVHPKTGQTGIVPKDQWGDEKKPGIAQTQGYVMSPREQQRIKTKTAAPIQQAKTNYDALALTNMPTGADPHNPGNPNLNAVPASERQSVNNQALATQASVLAGQGGSALAGKLMAPTVTSQTIGTGILGPGGEEIMREGVKYGPSAVAKAMSNPAARKILEWVGHGVLGTVGGGAAWKALKTLGLMK